MKFRKAQIKVEQLPRVVEAVSVSQELGNRELDERTGITQQDQQEIRRSLELVTLTPSENRLIVNLVANLKTAHPDFGQALAEEEVPKQAIQGYYNSVQQSRFRDTRYLHACKLGRVATLLTEPEQRAESTISPEDFSNFSFEIDRMLNENKHAKLLQIVELIMINFPEKKAELGLTEHQYQAFIKKLEESGSRELWRYLKTYCIIAVAYPEHRDGLKAIDECVKYCKDRLDYFRSKGLWIQFAVFAKYLSLFTADEIEYTSQGVRAIHKLALSQVPSLPNRKVV